MSVITSSTKGAAERLSDLATAVQGVGPGTSLRDKVHIVQTYLAAGNTGGTCSKLSDFISQVQALAGKKIPTTEASPLVATARSIKVVLSC